MTEACAEAAVPAASSPWRRSTGPSTAWPYGRSCGREEASKGAELKKDKLVRAILDGVAALAIEDKMPAIEERKAQLAKDLETAEEPPLLHPNMAKVYSRKINALYEALRSEEGRPAAADLLRTLIDRIELTPNAAGNLDIDLFGDLAGILSLSANKNGRPDMRTADLVQQVKVVAGAGFEPATFRL